MLERGKNERVVIEMVDTASLAPPGHLLRQVDAAVEFEKLYEIVEPLVTRAVTCWKQWSPPEMSTTAQRLMMN